MRDPKRIPEILKQLEVVWKKYPDLRLGQLLVNSLYAHKTTILFFIEDDKLIEEIEKFHTPIGVSGEHDGLKHHRLRFDSVVGGQEEKCQTKDQSKKQ